MTNSPSKKISEMDYASLLGLKLLAEDADKALRRMVKCAAEIVGEELDEYDYGYSADFIYDGNTSLQDFLRRVDVKVDGHGWDVK